MPKKKAAELKKVDYSSVKSELLDDLEQFLLDQADLDQAEMKVKKQSALKELDKLIRQDLTYNQILSSLKKEVKAEEKSKESVKPSAHVIDLRYKINVAPKAPVNHVSFEPVEQALPQVEKAVEKTIEKPRRKRKQSTFSLSALRLNHVGAKIVLFAFITLIVLLPIRGLSLFSRISSDTHDIYSFGSAGLLNFEKGVLSASENSFDTAQISFGEALSQFQQAQKVLDEYHSWALDAASALPLVGSPISLGRNLLVLATDMSSAAKLLDQKKSGNSSPTEYIDFIYRQIKSALPYLKQASQDAEKINTSLLPDDMRQYFDTLKKFLPTTYKSLYGLTDVFDVVLQILGHSAERRYLVLFQNNNELRATGGFIGSFALFDVYQGKVINVEIPKGGTYDLDAGQTVKYKAPKALSLINPDFNIWDANWWSDFPTSAKKISSMFQKAGGSSVDGVIAINSDVLKELLIVLGPIDMPEYNMHVTADNLYDVLQEKIETTEDGQPKAVIADLVPTVMARLLNFQGDKTQLAETLIKVLSTKDIQIYSTHNDVQDKLVQFGWAGDLKSPGFDYLQVVNTNIAGGKTDNDIVQTIDHQAQIASDGSVVDTVRVTRVNQGLSDNPFAGIDGGNVSYMRIYVPEGSQLLEAQGFDQLPSNLFHVVSNATQNDPDVAKEENKLIDVPSNTEIYQSLDYTVFANWLALKPGESKTVLVKYKLPGRLNLGDPLVTNWVDKIFKKDSRLDNYSLLVQPQSGAGDTIFNSSVLLPENIKVVWSNSTEANKLSVTDHLVSFSNNLVSDEYYGFIVATK